MIRLASEGSVVVGSTVRILLSAAVSIGAPFLVHWTVGRGLPSTRQVNVTLSPSSRVALLGELKMRGGTENKDIKIMQSLWFV